MLILIAKRGRVAFSGVSSPDQPFVQCHPPPISPVCKTRRAFYVCHLTPKRTFRASITITHHAFLSKLTIEKIATIKIYNLIPNSIIFGIAVVNYYCLRSRDYGKPASCHFSRSGRQTSDEVKLQINVDTGFG